ncbi:MAG TPA: substrate-binding domain-containing protein [Vicinamibacterales bacterium]|jgi:ribose transport system substrate-binding protein|nr:substrate-binding domain-containing protein [Vicinamibacterales bacterium]
MRRASLALLAAATLLLPAACNRGAGSGKPRIAMVLKTLNNPFFIDMQRGAEDAAKRLNVDLTVQAAERETDVEKQMQIIENLVETGVNALAIAPSGSKEVVTAVAKANAANIPVVIVDDKVDAQAAKEAGVHWEAYVGSDNVEGGRIAGRYLAQLTNGSANVALLEGIPGHQTGDARLKGFKEAIQSSPGIKIVASQTANWERDQGFNVFQNMLQAHPDIDAVFACNDMMALGAVEAIRAAGKTGKIRVIGFDAIDDARKAIAAGTMDGSVAQFPSEMGRIAIENAVKLIQHQPVQAETATKLEMITKANVR